MHELWPTAKSIADRDTSRYSTCLRYKKSMESFNHIYQCESRDAKSAFRTSFHTLLKDLRRLKTAEPILNSFRIILLALQQGVQPKCPQYAFGAKSKFIALQKEFQHQSLLGTVSLHAGYLSYKWSIVVQTLYASNSFQTRYNVPCSSQEN